MPILSAGSQAPDFSLLDQDEKEHTLSKHRGQWVLIYFYPKDDTPGCTKEACTLRDSFPDFTKIDAAVFGISADTSNKHKTFAEKYALPFTLLSDSEKSVIESYGAWGQKKFMGREYMGILRISYLIDPKGKIAKVYEKVKPTEHAAEVLKDIQLLTN